MRISRSVALIGSFQFGISGPLDCHIYAVRGPAGVALIDAGAGTHTDRVLANLRTDFETEVVDDLAITHCHLDPCGGAASLHQKTGCRVIVPERAVRYWKLLTRNQPVYARRVRRYLPS